MSAELRSRLASCALFRDIAGDDAALSELADSCEVRAFPSGEVIIREGSEGHRMYVILGGKVRVEKLTPSQESYTVGFWSEGEFFGELSLLDRAIRSATVIAETDCQLLSIDRMRFLAFGDRCPAAGLSVTRRVAERVAERLRRSNEDVSKLFAALVDEIEQRL